ncbi:isoleucine--tRNA ligase [Thermofilum pendens]|uniref:Isoleucine--tRNA ligase n=1 Tax=Thermofilum pendens (strain DSM 2475 / Hrk 5) TaxID=368408 RepID=A1RWG0_THEPD|nr:isoleucine--tRNA ligase [Thermofilum pendens]ABL77540.1 Isoleucyl-tRNA synthetase [Thermofilum pendens Hrk 5]
MVKVRSLEQRFEPKKYEEEVLKFWDSAKVYDKVRESLKNSKRKYYFLDGPPYPSSSIPHVGTLWNKILKDAIIRFHRASGYSVHDQPGYDCHGLPIEVQIERKLGFKSKKDIEEFGVEKFVEECKSFALQNVEGLSRSFKDFGVSMDWDKPYLTMTDEYIESAWWLVKKAEEKGLLDYGLKVVHWCPRCETTLADYEVTEYRDLEDPSIYVKFPLKDNPKKHLLIWTTTPWTLPANVAVMVNPDLEYSWVDVGGEEVLVATERVEAVMKEAGIESYRVTGKVMGRELEGLRYVHPLEEEVDVQRKLKDAHRVVLSKEYVSAAEGTGLVHMATGHGEEDYKVGVQYGLPVFSLVDDKGFMEREAGKYAGIYHRDANKLIVDDLRSKGFLFHEGRIKHRYPVCWRCKTPLVLRATRQWYIRVTQLKERFLEEAGNVDWVPKWAGYSRFRNWLEGLRDWIISRQRYWGTPAPIWVCGSCGHRVVVGSKDELERFAGRKLELRDLHRPWVDQVVLKCPKCGGEMRRVPDVLDVWLDSGVAFYASLGYPKNEEKFRELMPVDLIIEGHDQIAGWFFSLLRCGLIAFDRSPYLRVLMHGFALDEQGREMHKSLGNYVEPRQVLEYEYGSRDVFRWFVLKNTVWEDLRFSWRGLEETYSDLNILWNVYYFATMYMSLDGFDPALHRLEDYLDRLKPEDRWILSRLGKLASTVTSSFKELNVHKAARDIRNFVVEDLSHWYVRLVRPRVWLEEDVEEKKLAYVTLYHVLLNLLVLASPILPFTTEKIYRDAFYGEGLPESIHMYSWPSGLERFIDEKVESEMSVAREIVEVALSLRMRKGVKIRQPLPALYVLTDSPDAKNAVEKLRHIISSQVNVKEVKVLESSRVRDYRRYKLTPVYRALGPVFKSEAGLVAEKISSMSDQAFIEELLRNGSAEVEVNGKRYRVTSEMVQVSEEWLEGFFGDSFSHGFVVLDLRASERELAEGFARDLLRRIQYMRKELSLPVNAEIDVSIWVPADMRKYVEEYSGFLKSEARCRNLALAESAEGVAGDYRREWEIGDFKVVIGLRRV